MRRRQFLWAVAVTAGLAGCARLERLLPLSWANRQDAIDENGQPIMALLPRNYADTAAPLVIYHHGAGEDQEALLTDELKREVVIALVGAGYIVAGTNAHGENWGNQPSLEDYDALIHWCREHYNINRIVFLAQSMGGLSGLLSYAASDDIKGTALIYPICNLGWTYTNQAGFKKLIETAYDIHDDYPTQTAGHDPVLLDPALFNGKRFRFWASPDDTVVPMRANTDAMVARVQDVAAECEVVKCQGEHGDTSHFRPDDVLAFFERCL